MTPKRVWQLVAQNQAAADRLANAVPTSQVVARLLVNRGITDPDQARLFLDCPMTALHDPEQLPGMAHAVDLVLMAMAEGQPICIYGDYDADGITGTTVLLGLFQTLGLPARFYVPNRLEEGYGLNADAVRQLADDGVKLLITVDCGIASVDEVALARQLGCQVIVTDHHEFKSELPPANVLIHPRLPGSAYPFADLSGAGVAFKLAWAVAKRVSQSNKVKPEFREFLLEAMGFAALGLIADVVPLQGENRILVRHGLTRLAQSKNLGVRELIDVAKLGESSGVKAEDVAFRLAPRINAVGRLGCARLVVDLFTTKNRQRAKELAQFLEGQNIERQSRERKMTQQAKELVLGTGYESEPGLVLASADWHPGVVGIVAGRLAETFARPVLLAAHNQESGQASGSGRSIPGFPLHKALAACDDILLSHGGHAAAAGFRIAIDKIDELRQRFAAEVENHFPDGLPAPKLRLETEVPLSALSRSLLAEIHKLEPYGADNPRPRFLATDLQIEEEPRKIGNGERHLSFRVRQGETVMRAVAWGMAERLDDLMSEQGRCCLAFTPRINEWQGLNRVEIEVTDFRPGPTTELEWAETEPK